MNPLVSAVVALLCILSRAHCRQLPASAPAEVAPCTGSWTAQLGSTLANTLMSSSDDLGTANILLEDNQTLVFQVEVMAGGRIKGIALQQSDNRSATPFELSLTTQMSDAVTVILTSGDSSFNVVLDLLRSRKTSLAVRVLADKPMVLVGSLRNDCQSATKEVSVTWSEEMAARAPACNVPGFSELYMVACSGFAERVESVCSIRFEDVLLASAFDAEGELVGNRLSACLPKGCDPCRTASKLPLIEVWGDIELAEGAEQEIWLDASKYDSFACRQPGFESYYPVPSSCTDLPERLVDACGVEIEEVLEASAMSLDLTEEGVCLPRGCDPCVAHPGKTRQAAGLEVTAPFCENSYFFTEPYRIPSGCEHFSTALVERCKIEPEAVADASGMHDYPFDRFGEAQTVCLPQFCDPCSQPWRPQATAVLQS